MKKCLIFVIILILLVGLVGCAGGEIGFEGVVNRVDPERNMAYATVIKQHKELFAPKLPERIMFSTSELDTELKAGDSLQVSLGKSAKNATVRVTDEAKAYAKASLGALHTVRSGNRLQVSFNASSNLEGKMARVDILDLKGRVLATRSVLVHGGTANLSMDVPGSGLYVVRARAQGIHRSELFSVK